MYKKFFFRPIEHGLTTEYTPLNQPLTLASWGAKNFRLDEKSARKRWGYGTADRAVGNDIYGAMLYQTIAGSRFTLYLTDTDLIKKETASGKTWSYQTETYTTGTITTIANTAVTGSGTTWVTGMANDYFVLDEDHVSDVEPDSSWRKIASVTDTTHLTLSSAYEKDVSAVSETYKIRQVYTTPENERWTWAIVNDKFVFTNGNTNVQSWTGGTYAADLETGAGHATKARYSIEYANRLFLLDYGTTRDPQKLGWSKENDPTNYIDTSAGTAQLFETAGYGTGLGKSGSSLLVFQEDLINFFDRTGILTSPISRTVQRTGVGNIAPYSIVDVRGTCAFLSRDDFYIIDGDYPKSIGEKIREKFFDIVGKTEIKKTFGAHISELNEVLWITNTTEGKLCFAWNYKYDEWEVYEFAADITAVGKGAI